MSALLLNKLKMRTMPIISFHLKIPSTFDKMKIFNFIKSRMTITMMMVSGDAHHCLLFFEYLRDALCAHFLTLSFLDLR